MPTLEETTTWSRNLHPEQATNNTIIIMAGTNDIKNGKTAKKCNKQVREIENNLKGLNIEHLVVQQPPVYPPPPPPPQGLSQRRDRETTKLNGMLEAIIAEADLVHTQAIEGDRDAIETDGLHLTRKAAEKMAKKIAEKLQSHQQTTSYRSPQTSTTQHTSQNRHESGEMERYDRHRNRNGQSPTKHSRTNNRTPRRETKKNENDLWRRNRQRRRKTAKNLHHHRKQRKRRRSKTSNRKNQRRRGKKWQTTGNPTSTQV